MAHPRMVRPGVIYMVTRRCYQRTFRLRPCDETNAILRYCLAVAAAKTAVHIHAAIFMSNHHHIVLTDVEGRLPEFTREFHRLTAKALNAAHGERENLWNSQRAHALELSTEDDIVEKLAYVITNPVAAELVPTPAAWPGVLIEPVEATTTMRVTRPRAYFGEASSAPRELELVVQPLGLENIVCRVRLAASGILERTAQMLRDCGRAFLGAAAAKAASVLQRATAPDKLKRSTVAVPASSRPASPRRAFLRAYAEALARRRAGEQGALFPAGTWWMRVFWSAPTALAC